MTKKPPHLFFAHCNLLNITEILLKKIEVDKENEKILEKVFWEGALHFEDDGFRKGTHYALPQHGWQQSWIAIRLLHILHNRTARPEDITDELEGTLASSRKEAFFTSLLQHLEHITHEDCKALKRVFSKVSLSNLISKSNILPKLNSSTEEALFRSLVDQPGETHFLLKLLFCDHEAFTDITRSLEPLYTSAVKHCSQHLLNCDASTKKKHVNVLYTLLLVMPADDSEELGRMLYSLCQTGDLDFSTLLTVVGCQNSPFLYNYLSSCENRRMFRHVDCSTTLDVDLLNNVFNVITNNGHVCLEELCLRVISSKGHWVEELVGMASQFVVMQDQEKLEALVSFPALWPALAINLWKHLSTRSDILDIVNPIINMCQRLYPSMFSLLHQTTTRLKVMTDWLRKEGEASLPDINVMLSLTRNHSTLYVLQSATHFVGLDHSRLMNLLLQLEGPNSWNVRVFEGFTILFSAFQILVKAVDVFNEFGKEETKSELMCLKYKEEVSKPISELNQSLNKIEPLDFRLELLEDLFLLLFLRSEDFCEDKCHDESSPDDYEDMHNKLIRSVSDGAALERGVKPASLPTPLHRKCSSPCRTASSSSCPSSSQRKYSSHSRRDSKTLPMKFTQGFVCYPWLVSDMLNCLKRSLEYLETGCERLTRLKEYVEDASWRLDMVSEPDCEGVNSRSLGQYWGIDDDWVYTNGDSSDSDSPVSTPPSPVRRIRRQRRAESESGSNTTSAFKFSSSPSSVKSRKSSRLFSTSSTLINLMLASPVSLVSYFIAREDLARATKAVEKFNMKGCAIDVELHFLKEFIHLRKKLEDVHIKTVHDTPPVNDSKLQAISETTSSGALTVTLTKLIETFFALTPLPEEVGNSKGVVVLDLALSHSTSLQHSASLLDLARNYFNGSPINPVTGSLRAFTSSIRSVVQEADSSTSLSDILLDPSIPLKTGHGIKNLSMFWTTLEECLTGFQSAVLSGDDDLADAAYLKLTTCAVTGQGLVQNYQDDTKKNFLNQLRLYLSCLWKVVSPNIPEGTKYHILQCSLESLVGELVFSESKDPLDLEAALQPLAINVLQLVVANCTPSVNIKQLKRLPSTIVLNSNQEDLQDCGPCPPDMVASLLTELLDCINDTKTSALHSLPASPRVQQVLRATGRLQQLDLTGLSPGNQLFALLVNLHNLIWLHALITLEIPDQYGLVSLSSCLRDLSASCVGYVIGKDCFVSLAELRHTIAPCSTPLVTSTVSHKSLPVSTSSDPRAVFLLANPYKLSPALQVLPSYNMDQEVDARMSAFVTATVQISENSVIVPITLYHYIDYVTLTQGTESEFSVDDISNSSREHLVDFLKEFFKREDISDIIIKKDIGLKIAKNYNSYSSTEEYSLEGNLDSWKSKEIKPEVLKFVSAKNPLLGLIVEKIHCIERGVESVKTPAASPLERQLSNPAAISLGTFYDHNVMLATLKSTVDSDKLWLWLDTAVQKQDWLACLDMLTIIPEKQTKTDPRFVEFRDFVLEQLSPFQDGWRYCQTIADPRKLCELTLANLEKWSLHGCITMLHVILSMEASTLPLSAVTRAKQLETSMETTSKVTKACTLTLTDDAWAVVEELLKCEKVNLALQWFHQSDLIHAEHTSHNLLLIGELLLELLERGQEVSAQELLQLLPTDQAVRISESLAHRARSISSLQQIVHFLQSQEATPAQALRYNYLDIGVHMLNHIPWQEQEWYHKLVSQPELLVEQLLMSTRISTLETILQNLQSRISSLPPSSPLSPPCLDALLRRYASKAVDVRVRTKMLPPRRLITPELSTKFTPPEVPPTKQEWIGNDEVTECMCCEATMFSMFNRRHHCRRCGRVVCGVCSPHRIKVAGYGNVKVRICSDCYDYSLPKAIHPDVMSGPRSTRAESKDSEPDWWLTKDLVYNSTVREEFTYTHAPSVSLCLSILKLHSEHSSLLRFLFTTIETMLQLLRPICPGIINPEVDYSLLVTMIRSLLEFAKLSCSQHGSASDWATVDGLFAEVDLLGMLVASPQTCALLPTEPLRGQSALSTLRENLLKSELWTLALEVSTKAGLDYNSVWLAWGKACLKAGAWTDARDKFAHCNPHKKDTQLLADILQILQDNPQITDLKSRLSRLKTLSTKPDAVHTSNSLEPRVYEECLYYLRTYGSHASTLTFYLGQNDIKSAVCMLLETPVDIQVYLDSLFLPALRSARVTQLYTCMSDIDKSLAVFKDYLRASCAYFERHKLFNVLYQAQVWMNDHVRAAMTCIHFFKHNARSYRDLAANRIHLETALGHLQLTLKQSGKESSSSLVMHLPKEAVIQYISTIRLQLEVLVFMMTSAPEAPSLTLFGSSAARVSLASTIVAVGNDLNQSFSLAAKVAEDWQLQKSSILCPAAVQLAREGRTGSVQKLVALLEEEAELCNQILIAVLKERPSQSDADPLIALITDVPLKITALIECGQLKSAYLLAVKHDRLSDIQRILNAAVQLDQPLIRKICLKRLNLLDDL